MLHQGTSNESPQHMFLWRNEKKYSYFLVGGKKKKVQVMLCLLSFLSVIAGYDRSIPGFPRYSIIGSNSQEYNLQIINVNLDDDAIFQCQVGPAVGNPPLLAEAHLQVLGEYFFLP